MMEIKVMINGPVTPTMIIINNTLNNKNIKNNNN